MVMKSISLAIRNIASVYTSITIRTQTKTAISIACVSQLNASSIGTTVVSIYILIRIIVRIPFITIGKCEACTISIAAVRTTVQINSSVGISVGSCSKAV